MTAGSFPEAAPVRSGRTSQDLGWHLGHILLAWLGAMFGSLVMVVIAGALGGETDDLWVTAMSQVGLWSGLLGGPILLSRRLGRGSVVEDFGLRMRPLDACWALLGPVLQVAISLAYLPFVSDDELSRPARELADRASGSGWQFALLAVATAVGAPLVEELFFRGLLLRTLWRSLPAWVAIAISGVVFGAIHFQPLLLPALAAFGVVAGVLTVRTGRLGPAIWLHIGFNAVTMAALANEMF